MKKNNFYFLVVIIFINFFFLPVQSDDMFDLGKDVFLNKAVCSTCHTLADAGSGGDAGDNATAAYNLSVTSGSTYAGYADQNDTQDWYLIFVPTGKGITASMSFNGVTNGTNDLDLVLIDSTVSFYIDTSYYSNPEVVNSSGTNVSGQYVYLVVNAFSGFK